MVTINLDRQKEYINDYNGVRYTFKTWMYDFAIFLFDIVFTIFFREITVRGSYYIPVRNIPTILVCAPHANQFIDPIMVMSQTRKIRGSCSRQVCMVTAEASMKKNIYVKLFSTLTGAIPVARIQDNLSRVNSCIKLYIPNYDTDPCLVKLVVSEPYGDKIVEGFSEGSLIGLPDPVVHAQIEKVIDKRTLKLRKPFPDLENVRKVCSEPTEFNYAEKIDNGIVYQKVFDHLRTGGCVGIFPEGGSHDRPSLLPLKAGVAIMALSAVAADPSLEVEIVPCGLHYFHRDKFRSRAALEYIEPIKVTREMGRKYRHNPKKTVASLLKIIQDALFSITVNADDFETLETIQAARRLCDPVPLDDIKKPEKLPLSTVVELTRRLLAGYSKFKNEPRIRHLKDNVDRYNKVIHAIGLEDHQVIQLKSSNNIFSIFFKLLRRCALSFLMVLTAVPGTVIFSPVFIACKYMAKKKAKEGLKKSVVKIKGNDLIATWKILIALTMAPIVYTFYSMITVFVIMEYPECTGYAAISSYVVQRPVLCFFFLYFCLVVLTYLSFKTGEMGIDIFKSIPPLFLSLIYPMRTCNRLCIIREQLKAELVDVCKDYGPFVSPEMVNFQDQDETNFKNMSTCNNICNIETTNGIFDEPRNQYSSMNSSTSSFSNSTISLTDLSTISNESDFSTYDYDAESEFANVDQSIQSKIFSLIYEQRERERGD